MINKLPPFKYLITFDAAARLGNFSKAAEELSLTQSAISQQLLKLEEWMGQRLFFRHGKGVGLTAAGELLHETVKDSLEKLASGLMRIEPYKNKASVIIACPADFAHGWLTPQLGLLKLTYPNIEVWLMTEKEVREIDRIDVDLIISRRPIYNANIECVALFEDYTIAICGSQIAQRIQHHSYPKILESAPILLLESEPVWYSKSLGDDIKNLRITRGATIDDSRLLLEAVIRELGIGFVSHALAFQALKDGQVKRLSQIPEEPRSRLWLMRSNLEPRTPFSNIVFNWMKQLATMPTSV
ncbi:MAG: LysR family transcriptional regulator [Methylotenera sp.]|nr:LysR family transcriptional regulator [Methylotenera sp.]